MSFLKKLFGADEESVREEMIQEFLRKAEDALRNDDIEYCMAILEQARQSCRNKEEIIYLFACYRSAPSNPQGVAFLADYSICIKENVDNTLRLLKYIEGNVGTGMYLCEVWFSLYQVAIVQRNYDEARIAFFGCLNSQRSQSSEKFYRITRKTLLERGNEIMGKYSHDMNRMAEIAYLITILEKSTEARV